MVKELRTAIKRYRIGQVDVDVDWAIEKFEESCDIIDTWQAKNERLEEEIVQLKTQALGGSENDACAIEGMDEAQAQKEPE